MRIVAGKWRGRIVDAPKGRDTRPTTDRVKESLMSSIASARGFEGACVLDAFAGSGQLGLEALSRGARHVVFCDSANAARRVISANAAKLEASRSDYRIIACDILKGMPAGIGPFDIVYLDPPYATPVGHILGLLGSLGKAGAISDGAVISYEHSAGDSVEPADLESVGLEHVSTKRYGDIAIDLIRKADQ